MRRASYVAQNVRYEDGVVCNARGYSNIKLSLSILTSLVTHWRLEEVSGPRVDAFALNDLTEFVGVGQSAGKIGNGASVPSTLTLLTPRHPYLHSESAALTYLVSGPFTVAGWVNFSQLTSPNPFMTFPGVTLRSFGTHIAADLYDSVAMAVHTQTFAQTLSAATWYFIVLVYSGTQVTLYVNNVADTPYSIVLGNINAAGSSPPSQTFTLFANAQTGATVLDSVSVWSRALTPTECTFLYNSGSGIDFPFLGGAFSLLFQGNLINSTPTPLVGASGGTLQSIARSFDGSTNSYLATPSQIFSGNVPNTGYPWFAQNFFDKILFAQHDNIAQLWIPSATSTQPIPGLPSSDAQWDGVEVFFGHALLWKDDRMKWSDINDFSDWIPVGVTAASATLTVATGGFVQPAINATVAVTVNENPSALGITVGQFMRITETHGGVTYYSFYAVTAVTTTSVTLRLQDLTGATATGFTIPSGTQILTVNANEAGETRVVGSAINGPIFRIIAMGDYAYIFKERCIVSVQYVGITSGTFFTHPEVSEEGLLSRTCLLNLGDGRLVFLGHKELYTYQGGPNPQPVCQQYTRQVFRELDRTRLDKIILHHNEARHEVWVQYPVTGGFKVLIWNYVEDTASIDIYDPGLLGFSAVSVADWSVDPPWTSLSIDQTWANTIDSLRWSDLASGSKDRATIIAMGTGDLLLWGTGFNRAGRGYPCLSETTDYDLDEPDIWKYVDVVALGLQVLNPTNQVRNLTVQLGTRVSLDDDITWTAPVTVSVAGNAPNPPLRINPGGAGKYMRLRFQSTDPDVEWRVSSFEVHCRPGGFY